MSNEDFAYQNGELACRDGYTTKDNPYSLHLHRSSHIRWLEGFAAQAAKEAEQARKCG